MTTHETALDGAPSGQAQVDDLNQQAWTLRVTDSNEAFALSSRAIGLAKQMQYETGLAEGLRTLGFCHIRLSQHTEALAALEQSATIFDKLNHKRGLSDVYEYFGIIHRTQGDYVASLHILFKSNALREELQYGEGLALSFYHIGVTYKYLGDFENALQYSLQGLAIAQQLQAFMPESYLLNSLGGIYFETHDYEAALDYYNQSLVLRQCIGDLWGEAGCLDNIGTILLRQHKPGEALPFFQRGLLICQDVGDPKGQSNTLLHIGEAYQQSGDPVAALDHIQQSLTIRKSIGDKRRQAELGLFLGDLHRQTQPDYAVTLLRESLRLAQTVKAKDLIYKIHHMLAETLKQTGDFSAALTYFELARDGEKEVINESVSQKLVNLQIAHRVEQSRKEAELYQLRNEELARLVEEIQQKNSEIEQQKNHLSETLQALQNTQTQLIQKEKLASLGELTAGIAHEIQNPLNFVNNFSEVSVELMGELKDELDRVALDRGDMEEAKAIADNLTQNLQKITLHGGRASAIVKGMLEHSRTSTGERKPTDLNVLTDEYLRLAYQGLKANRKYSSADRFNCELITDLAPELGKIEVTPQEIGRVLLNLYNNAFYAVHQKQKTAPADYNPTVSLTTQRTATGVCIRVGDNGTGIPDAVKAKIFQPFFTTKPTGEGTGLGLSLSYDIITKGHGGMIECESTEGEGTMFTVMLPHN